MRRRAFVTGGTGFIGRHLVRRLLADGWAVGVLARSAGRARDLEEAGAELVVGDLSDRASVGVGVEGADVVFHLAAVTAARSDREYEVANSDGTANVLEGIRHAADQPRRLVYLSSYAAVGPEVDGRPRGPADEPAPLTAYGRTKLRGEEIARQAGAYGLEVLVVRSPAVFGPGDRALLPYFRLIRAGLAPLPGGGKRRLHLVYVEDLAAALVRAADAPAGTYPVADPRAYRWDEVVDAMAASLQKRPFHVVLPPSLVRSAAWTTESIGRILGKAVPFNREKAEEMLAPGWTVDLAGSEMLLPPPSVMPLEDAIEQTVRWYIRQGWL